MNHSRFAVNFASILHILPREARWPSGRASDSGAIGRGFDTYLRRIVSLSKDTFTPRKVLVIPRKRWLRYDMIEKLFTGTLSLNKTKTFYPVQILSGANATSISIFKKQVV